MTLFVSGLPTTMEAAAAERTLTAHFKQYGQLRQVSYKGEFAFVEFTSKEPVSAALAANKPLVVGGKTVTIERRRNPRGGRSQQQSSSSSSSSSHRVVAGGARAAGERAGGVGRRRTRQPMRRRTSQWRQEVRGGHIFCTLIFQSSFSSFSSSLSVSRALVIPITHHTVKK
jgi:RNA recognition motif-containing protein